MRGLLSSAAGRLLAHLAGVFRVATLLLAQDIGQRMSDAGAGLPQATPAGAGLRLRPPLCALRHVCNQLSPIIICLLCRNAHNKTTQSKEAEAGSSAPSKQ